jgi:hypothetical protein
MAIPATFKLLVQMFVFLDPITETLDRRDECVFESDRIGLLQSCDFAMYTPELNEGGT